MNRNIDHIVYCVPDLNEAIDYIDNILGVRPVIGGRHTSKGTKNALLHLGNKCYLEILAIDNENEDFEGMRWMGIDLIDRPKITRWSLKSNRLEEDSSILSKHSSDLGIIEEGSRLTTDDRRLAWQMILPATSPEVELLPFMTDWSHSDSHPTDTLAGGCLLQSVELFHPNPAVINDVFSELNVEVEIKKASQARIMIHVQSPNGLRNI